jgi:hypothetical protein
VGALLWPPVGASRGLAARPRLSAARGGGEDDPFSPRSPLDPVLLYWNDGLLRRRALAGYEDRQLPEGTLVPARLAVLADALIDARATEGRLLGHLREPGRHFRGCAALDAVLGTS